MSRPDPPAPKLAFYDFDGTLVSSNVVTQYAFFARNAPAFAERAWRYARLFASIPLWLAVDRVSRTQFNRLFYREFRGIPRSRIESLAARLLEEVLRPATFAGAPAGVAADRAAGFVTVLLTGSIDLAIAPAARALGFDHVIANRLEFRDGAATGRLLDPLIAGPAKVDAMRAYAASRGASLAQAKAYSDSISDAPMLEAAGFPSAVNPDSRLRSLALARGWPILEWKLNVHHGSSSGHSPAQ